MDWFRDHMAETWLAVAILLGVAELASLDLVLAMLAVGALAGVLTALVTDAAVVQFLVVAATSVAMLALVRPSLARRLHGGPDLQLGHGKLVGRQALVTETLSALTPGRVKLAGEIWSAQPYDETLTIEAGETVEVYEIRGATAYVHPVPRLDP